MPRHDRVHAVPSPQRWLAADGKARVGRNDDRHLVAEHRLYLEQQARLVAKHSCLIGQFHETRRREPQHVVPAGILDTDRLRDIVDGKHARDDAAVVARPLEAHRVLDRVVDLHAIQLVLEPPIAATLRHEAVVGRVLAGDGARTQPSGRRLRRDERAAPLLLDLDQPCLPHHLHARRGVRTTQRDLAQGRESTCRLIDRRDVPLPHVEVHREQPSSTGRAPRQIRLLGQSHATFAMVLAAQAVDVDVPGRDEQVPAFVSQRDLEVPELVGRAWAHRCGR